MGGSLNMPFEKAAAIGRLAYNTTFTTGCMAGGAVVAEHFIQCWVVFGNLAVTGVDRCPITGFGYCAGCWGRLPLLLRDIRRRTLPAVRRAGNQTFMRRFLFIDIHTSA